jgi:hypothetical protein
VATFYFVSAAILLILETGMKVRDGFSMRGAFAVYGLALACAILGVGIELAREWARIGSGVLGVVLASLALVLGVLITLANRWDSGMILALVIWAVMLFAPWVVVAIYSFLPSTKVHFAEVRNAKDRARAVMS